MHTLKRINSLMSSFVIVWRYETIISADLWYLISDGEGIHAREMKQSTSAYLLDANGLYTAS